MLDANVGNPGALKNIVNVSKMVRNVVCIANARIVAMGSEIVRKTRWTDGIDEFILEIFGNRLAF